MGQCHSARSTVGDVEEGGRRREGDEATWSSLKNKCFTIAVEQRSRKQTLKFVYVKDMCGRAIHMESMADFRHPYNKGMLFRTLQLLCV
ncbi:hypothetical protein GQ457_14G011000 [Hibiscus cannabinus]